MKHNGARHLPLLIRSTTGRVLARGLILSMLMQLSLLGELTRSEAAPVPAAAGAAVSMFGPKDYVRRTGGPVVVTDTFRASAGNVMLRIDNGGFAGQYARVSSAIVTLNGVVVVAPHEFNPKVGVIQKTVPVAAVNTITVELRSGPGSGITLELFGESTVNHAPTADAGPDQTRPVGQMVTLDGSRSSDPDGDALTFQWSVVSIPAGSTAHLSDPHAVRPTFVVDKPGTYQFQLVVSDGSLTSAPDGVSVTTENSPPVADAGPDQTAVVGATVTLDGHRSSDVDGDPLTFHWSFVSRPAGSTAILSDPASVAPGFTIDRPGTYVAQLIVNDGAVDSAPDTVNVSTVNSPPVADAGPDQTVLVGATVTLGGSRSHDADGDSLTFRWAFTSRPAGSTAALSNPSTVTPSFVVDLPGTYVVQLIVNDGTVDSAPDTVNISTMNSPPVANAGPDQTALVGATVTLNGRGSHDADGNLLTFRWAFTSRPLGSAAALSDPTAASPTFVADVPGSYVVQLIVNDGTVDSAPDTVSISTINSAPVADAGPDQTVFVGATVTLDGTHSHDADGDLLTYRWTMTSRPVGSAASLVRPLAPNPTFVVDFPGTYVVQLVVNDGTVDSAPNTVTISTINSKPVANAGPDQTVTVGDLVTLDGSRSSDADHDPLTYRWAIVARPAGSTATLSDVNAVHPTFTPDVAGPYVVQLIVNDGTVDSDPDTVAITANANTVIVPGVTGLSQAAAQAAIVAANLVVGSGTTENSDTVAEGLVIRQSPVAGTPVAPRSAVDLVISLGPSVPVLRSISLAPADASIRRGATQQYTATGVFSDSHTADLTAEAMWESTNGPVASITTGGLATGLDAGPTTIRATARGVTGSTTLTVLPPAITSIVVTPLTPIALVGETRVFTATGVLTDGTSQSLAGLVTWGSSSGAVASINAAGVATALGAGPTTISATKDGVTGGTTFTVQATVADPNPPVASITAPVGGAILTTPADVIGTATDANFSRYVLDFAPAGTTSFTTITTGTAPVNNGVLGTFDPTLLMNDQYSLRLTVFDRGGNASAASITVQVARDEKVGTYTLRFTDLVVPIAGLPIQVIRTYDTRNKRVGDFGFGWSLDIQTMRATANRVQGEAWQVTVSGGFFPSYCLQPTDQHKISITLPDGKVEEFDAVPSPQCQVLFPIAFGTLTYEARPGTLGSLVPLDAADFFTESGGGAGPTRLLDAGTFDVLDPQRFQYKALDGRVFIVNKSGVERMTDLNGNALTFAPNAITHSAGASILFVRDAQNRITRITDPKGNVLQYGYDANGDLSAFTDASNNQTRYLYNLSHGLIEIRDPLGRRPVRNEYDDRGRLIAHVDANGKRVEYTHNLDTRQDVVEDRNGFLKIYEYDAQGNIVAVTDQVGARTTYTYDLQQNRLSMTDALGNVTTYTYNAQNKKTSERNPLGGVTSYTYDGAGRLLTTTDPLGRVTTNTYDVKGNLISTTDQGGGVTSHTYDAQGNETSVTDPVGNVTSYTYDALGRMITRTDASGTTTDAYDANGNKVSETDPRGATVRFTYDANNRLVAVEDPTGGVSRKEFDAAGQVVAEVDALGNRTAYTYDETGRLVQTTLPDLTTLHYTYDAEGNRLTTTDQQGRVTRQTYDGRKKIVQTVMADGATSAFVYDAMGRRTGITDARGNTTTKTFDRLGRETSATDPLGNATLSEYDAVGNLTARTDPNGRRTRYMYDANNRSIQTIMPGGQTMGAAYDLAGRKTSETDAAGLITPYTYDALSRVTTVLDAAGGTTRFEYDAAGNRTAIVDARGNRATATYDLASRLLSRRLPNGATEAYAYDAAGRLTRKTDPLGRATQYTRDVRGQLLQKTYADSSAVSFTYTLAGKRASARDARGATSYTYDARDRMLAMTYPDLQSITYAYDAIGGALSISSLAGTIAYASDADGRLTGVTDPASRTTTYAYDAAGNRTGAAFPNGATTTYAYDSNERLTQLSQFGPASNLLAQYTYTLGPTGNRVQIQEVPGGTRQYVYDATYRLMNEQATDLASSPLFQNAFTYDAVGNRTQKTTTVGVSPPDLTAYAYNNVDQLLTEGGTTYAWDLNGNLTSKIDAGGATQFEYDFENRLIRMTAPGGAVAEYSYDVDGNRVEQRAGGATVRYLVDTNRALAQVLAEYTPAGALLTSYVYGNDLISMTRGPQTLFYHFDGGGSTRLLTGLAGAVTDTFDYDAFGNLLNHTGPTNTPFLFNGQQYDSTLGLYYLRARYYQPTTGRFTARDPADGEPLRPITLHKYLYAGCDPINNSDPSGKFFCTSTLDWGNRVHNYIGDDFLSQGGDRFANTITINTILGAPVPGGGLKPDLVDRGTQEVYEIKPVLSAAVGVAKLALYLGIMNAFDPQGRSWMGGFSYHPPAVIDIEPGVQALVFPPAGGLILYCAIDWRLLFAMVFVALTVSLLEMMPVAAPALAFAF